MSDAAVNLRAKNYFGLSSKFETQNSNANSASTISRAFGNTNKSIASKRIGDKTTYTQTSKYCGADLSTDLGDVASSFGNLDYSKTYELIYTSIDATTTSVTGFTGRPIRVVIPSIADGGRSVVDIGFAALSKASKMVSITIPSSVTSIAATALSPNPSLKSIIFEGNAPTLGFFVFEGLTAIVYYHSAATGFTNPFGGLEAVTIESSTPYAPTGMALTDLAITYATGEVPQIALTGHNHTANPHTTDLNTKDITGAIPSTGFGVPDFGVTTGTDATPSSASQSFNIEHIDIPDVDGSHLHGANTDKVTMALGVNFVGTPTSETETALETDLAGLTGFDTGVTSIDNNNANQAFKSFAFAAEGMAT